ncbi:Metal-dependent phosphohydrolase [Forsythia ovata]|uniref:Metal-dependent phosphohydrolase n=1 Tax=Forsythia ovata TaxID=205694 RepID=A0ABD1R368_9LAMI
MSRVISKSISLTPSLTCTHLRFLPFRTSSSTSSSPPQFPRMAAESSPSSSPSVASAIDFLSLCHRLKTTKREGWVRRQVENPESIADHMYRMGLMALISADIPDINRDKCMKMAIVHDIAEAIVGDITPSDGIPKHEKKSTRARSTGAHV